LTKTLAGHDNVTMPRNRFRPLSKAFEQWANWLDETVLQIGQDSAVPGAHAQSQLEFPVNSGYCFRIRSCGYRIGSDGVRTLKLLTEIYERRPLRAEADWLLRCRKQIRQLQAYDACGALSLVVARTHNPRLRVLAIWLRGRCGGTVGTSTLTTFCADPDDQTRKEIARALKRMGAWSHLRAMASSDANPRIRRIATDAPPPPFALRMSDLLQHFTEQELVTPSNKVFVAPDLEEGHGRLPKSQAMIRVVLERIRDILAEGH
jgi:hypothetical protein